MAARADPDDGRPAALAQIVEGPGELVGRMLYAELLDDAVTGAVRREVSASVHASLRAGRTARVAVGGDGASCPQRLSVLVHVHASRPRMLIFGAVDFAAALSRAGSLLGYRVTVCDARPVFATEARFPDANEVVADWPHRYLEHTDVDTRTAVCVLTHDAKFDVPLLRTALGLPVGYVGRTLGERLRLLREAGVPPRQLARLRSPIGLDLGVRTPEETAVSIVAEIVAHAHRGTGLPLSRGQGPIHRPVPVSWSRWSAAQEASRRRRSFVGEPGAAVQTVRCWSASVLAVYVSQSRTSSPTTGWSRVFVPTVLAAALCSPHHFANCWSRVASSPTSSIRRGSSG